MLMQRSFLSNIFSTNPALIVNTTLESLHLKSVSIKGPLLQWVLTNCLNLQRLSLHWCRANADEASSKNLLSRPLSSNTWSFLTASKISTLKHSIYLLQILPIIFYESEIDVEYCSVPSLVDATFGGRYFHRIFRDLDRLSGFSSQLEKLSIWRSNKVHSASSGFPTFVNVLQLEIVISQPDDYLLLLTSLIEACPLLHTFKLKLKWCRIQLVGPRQSLTPKNAQVNAISSHQHLKVVECAGYVGCASAAEIVLCLTWHAPMLRKIIFDTRQPQFIGKPREVCTSDCRDQMAMVRRTTELLAERIRGELLAKRNIGELLAKRVRGSQGLADVVIR